MVTLDALPDLPDHQLYAVVREWTPEETAYNTNELKKLVDAHWWKDITLSIKFAECLITIGVMREETALVALGKMALGDSLNIQGIPDRAWELLEEAGNLYLEAGDEVGWARTRIGRLPLSINFGVLQQGIADIDKARDIFSRHGLIDRLLRVDLNTGVVQSWVGNYAQCIAHYRNALQLIDQLNANQELQQKSEEHQRGPLHINLGYAYSFLGDLKQAQHHFAEGRRIFLSDNADDGVAIAELNLAYVDYLQGRYRRALYLLNGVLQTDAGNFSNAALAQQIIIRCYLRLNRFSDAAELAERVIAIQSQSRADYEMARTLGLLGTAVMELGDHERAAEILDRAYAIFDRIPAPALAADIQLLRGRLAMKQHDLDTALHYARAAGQYFAETDQKINHASALLLEAQALYAAKNYPDAAETSSHLLTMAKRTNVAPLRYNAHLLLAQTAQAVGDTHQAMRHYRAAVKVLQQIRQELTITLRTDFLQDKVGAFRALIALYIDAGQYDRAFQILEEEKAQLLLHYRAQRESLRWSGDDSRSAALLRELDLRRAAHHALGQSWESSGMTEDEVLAKLAEHEARMRQLTEQLNLKPRHNARVNAPIPTPAEVQAALPSNTVMLSYHDDGSHYRVFVLKGEVGSPLMVIPLQASIAEVSEFQRKFEMNVDDAIGYTESSPFARHITANAKIILQRLYDLLLAPVMQHIPEDAVLRIVPYGLLHYTPFHLLYTGTQYLVERHEVAILPAAALAMEPPVKQPAGALVLAHSWGGELPYTRVEAEEVRRMLGGDLYPEEDARISLLQAAPRQVLHIAAHGKQRPDCPELSFIELENGQIYMDDLLQHDLSYELVTLSACETGRSSIFAGEEVIGLGRGFLLAGAGALITTLWRISDHHTAGFMRHLYQGLLDGQSKSAALKGAMLAALATNPNQHPAFWGSFQIIGNGDPLSGI